MRIPQVLPRARRSQRRVREAGVLARSLRWQPSAVSRRAVSWAPREERDHARTSTDGAGRRGDRPGDLLLRRQRGNDVEHEQQLVEHEQQLVEHEQLVDGELELGDSGGSLSGDHRLDRRGGVRRGGERELR
jgi:hypothetical protein